MMTGEIRTTSQRGARFRIEATYADRVVIRDVGPWDERKSVTNDAEAVVQALVPALGQRRLFYYDTDNVLDELVVLDGAFAGFKPGGPR